MTNRSRCTASTPCLAISPPSPAMSSASAAITSPPSSPHPPAHSTAPSICSASPPPRRQTGTSRFEIISIACAQKRAKFGLALPALPGGEQRGAALARKIRAVCFEAFDDPAASGLYPAAIGPKIRPAGAAQQHRLLPRRQRWRNSIGRGHGCRRRLRRRGRRRLRVLSRGDRAGDRRDRLPASGRKALCVPLEAFQRCGAARRHARISLLDGGATVPFVAG